MPYYKINSRSRVCGYVEASKHNTIKFSTANHSWMVGKSVQTANEWLHRHNMQFETITDSNEIERIRAVLHPTQQLAGV